MVSSDLNVSFKAVISNEVPFGRDHRYVCNTFFTLADADGHLYGQRSNRSMIVFLVKPFVNGTIHGRIKYSPHFTLRTPAPFRGVGVHSLDVFASGQTFLLVRALPDFVTSNILLLVGQSMSSALRVPGASLSSTLRYARSVMYFQ